MRASCGGSVGVAHALAFASALHHGTLCSQATWVCVCLVFALPSRPPTSPQLTLRCSITGQERPRVWIRDPQRSRVLEVQADLRCIRTKNYATGYSMRFPRSIGVR